jgi:A/G-specific adenine glycosylase
MKPMTMSYHADPIATELKIETVREHLLTWFEANRRDLPWRHTRDPYRILIAEVMLQQTQVDRVIPYFEQFLERFPTVNALAEAPTAEVIRLWSGLGYNRRAVNLQRTAQAVVEQFGGNFPSDVTALRSLPGIGPYTAGAIACFAFELDSAFVDTNMRRVIHRLFAGPELPEPKLNERDVIELATRLVPPGDGWRWNQALIEFGALQCSARKPLCMVCPMQQDCVAFPTIQSTLKTLPKGTRLKQEGAFEGSNRWYRGRAIAALRSSEEGLSLTDLGAHLRADFTPGDLPWLVDLVRGLERDGLASVADSSPAYSADGLSLDAAGDTKEPVVRLPK